MRLIIILTIYLSLVLTKFPSPFPKECRLAGAFDVCKGSNCPPCWVPKDGGWDCYEYKSGKQCPFFAEDASEELAKLDSTEPSATPIEPSRSDTSKSSSSSPTPDPTGNNKPDPSQSDNPGPTSSPESDPHTPSRSYRSTSTYVVRVVVSSAPNLNLTSLSSSIHYLTIVGILLSII